jgi:hypothetical protein
MKFISAILITALLSYVGGLFVDWWIIAVAAFAVAAFIPQKPIRSFLSAFIALFLLWGILAAYIDAQNEHILSPKIAALLFKTSSNWLVIGLTAFIGGLVAGLAALTASFLRKKQV